MISLHHDHQCNWPGQDAAPDGENEWLLAKPFYADALFVILMRELTQRDTQ